MKINDPCNLGQLFQLLIERCLQLEIVVMQSGKLNIDPTKMMKDNQHSLKFIYLCSVMQGGIVPSSFRPLFRNSANLLAVFYARDIFLQSRVPLSELSKILSTIASMYPLALRYNLMFIY